jgi:lipid A 4'-phosphatase
MISSCSTQVAEATVNIPKQAEELVFPFAEQAIFDPEKTAPMFNSGPVFSESNLARSASANSQFFNLFGYKKRLVWWLLPLVLFFCYIPFSSAIDLKIADFFSVEGRFKAPKWTWNVYTYGLIPGQILFVISIVTAFILYFPNARSRLFVPSIYICLVLIVGGGLVSHAIFKQFWQRPRPKQTTLFGAKYPFCPLWKSYKGKKDRNLRSLPSGHASMGFYFFALCFVGRRLKKKYLALFGITMACFMGTLLSFARFSQGGHFFSDSVLSLIIMWETCYWLDRVMGDYFDSREAYT